MRWLPLFFLLVLAPGPVSAWPVDGLRVTGAPRPQQAPRLASDGQGGVFVTWADYRGNAQLGLGTEVYVQHVTAFGQIALGWPADGLLVATGPENQNGLIFADGLGGVLVLYVDTSVDFGDLYLQRITAAGAVAPGWPATGVPIGVGPGQQLAPELVSDGAGGAYASWQDGIQLDNSRARYTHVLGDGQLASDWPTNGRLFEPNAALVVRPLLMATAGGGFLACWSVSDDRLATARVLAQRFTADGIADPQWPAGGITVCPSRPFHRVPDSRLVSDGAGGFFVVLSDYRNSTVPFENQDLYLQHVLADGQIAAGWPADALPLATLFFEDETGILSEDGLGGVYVGWQDSRAGFPQVFGLHIGADGQRHAGWPAEGLRLSGRNTFQFGVSFVADGLGGAYLTWTELTGLGRRSYVKRVQADGTPALGWPVNGVPVASTGGDQDEAALLGTGSGGAIVAWSDSRDNEASSIDIYAQRFGNDGVVAAQVSLASAEATSDEVRVRWWVSGETRARVERREPEGEWQERAELDADGQGYMHLVDRDVRPGARYDYRLVLPGGARGGETSVQVPVLALSLEGARPNPAVGTPWLVFTLPDGSSARLALHDVAGRQVASREVGTRGAGRHVVRLADNGELTPGLYWATLTHGTRTLRTRVAVVR